MTLQEILWSSLNYRQATFLNMSIYSADHQEDKTIDTPFKLAVENNKRVLKYHPEKLGKLDPESAVTLLAHTALHASLLHDIRGQGLNQEVYNMACDIVVNLLLDAINNSSSSSAKKYNLNGFNVIQEFKGDSVEVVYNKLMKMMPPSSSGGNSPQNQQQQGGMPLQGAGGISDALGVPNDQLGSNDIDASGQSASPELEEKAIRQSNVALNSSSSFSTMPQELIDTLGIMLDKFLNARADWRELLLKYVDSASEGGMDYTKFNRRAIYQYLFLPDVEKQGKLQHLTCAIDVSGSISNKQAKALVNECLNIAEQYCSGELHIHTFNHGVVQSFELDAQNPSQELKLKVGGGTDIHPVLKKISKNPPEVLIVFTDMWFEYPKEETPFPVIWVAIDNDEAKAPFGEIIHVHADDFED